MKAGVGDVPPDSIGGFAKGGVAVLEAFVVAKRRAIMDDSPIAPEAANVDGDQAKHCGGSHGGKSLVDLGWCYRRSPA
jgi:hypothetical protein